VYVFFLLNLLGSPGPLRDLVAPQLT